MVRPPGYPDTRRRDLAVNGLVTAVGHALRRLTAGGHVTHARPARLSRWHDRAGRPTPGTGLLS